jgi:inner membrane protein
MASIGHIAVGMAAARLSARGAVPSWTSVAAWSALSMLPDADVIGFPLGIAYEDPWGHRGASHSLAFALGVAGAVGLAASAAGLPRSRTWTIAMLVLASHALLDTLTDGGLGCALWWPLSDSRYFAPWRPIPVSPIGLAFLSPYGAFVATVELLLFSPLILYSRRRSARTRRTEIAAAGWMFWAALVWLLGSSDPFRQAAVGWMLREDTEYAAGFSENAFAQIKTQMKETDVRQILGAPLQQIWYYPTEAQDRCRVIQFSGDLVIRWPNFDSCTPPGIEPGMTEADVRRLLGATGDACWGYTRSRNRRFFQLRTVCFEGGRVVEVFRRWTPGGA